MNTSDLIDLITTPSGEGLKVLVGPVVMVVALILGGYLLAVNTREFFKPKSYNYGNKK